MPATVEGRSCKGCKRHLPCTSYTARQWAQGDNKSLCATCVLGDYITERDSASIVSDESDDEPTTPRKLSAHFKNKALENPLAQGSFHLVASGIYIAGERTGQDCVGKWFSGHRAVSDDYFVLDMKTVDVASEIVEEFNKLTLTPKTINMNEPDVFYYTGKDDLHRNKHMLVEPYIENFQKFNSNTGWNDESSDESLAIQALSHFSYHHTNGNHLLCDLQGGIRPTSIILTDPAILSRNLEFGPTDLGPDGIDSFFSSHVCNKFCNREWLKPKNPPQKHEPVEGSSAVFMSDYETIFISGRS